MKPARVSPEAAADPEVGAAAAGFEIQFVWAGAARHILWCAELQRLDKGAWRANWKGEPVRYWSVPK